MSQHIVRRIISTAKAPKAIGPYNQAVLVDHTLYVSGQIGFVPETMKLVSDDVVEQAKQALTNMGHILEAGGSSYKSVVKTTVLLTDIKDYPKVNEVYASFFADKSPARAAYQAAALPANARVEIEAVAISGEIRDELRGMSTHIVRRIIITPDCPKPIGPYCHAVCVGRTVYLSGQTGVDPETMKLVGTTVEEQTRQTLINLGHVLKAAGSSFDKVVKVNVLLADIRDYHRMNAVYQTFFPKHPPARAAYQVAALPNWARVEIEMIAVTGDVDNIGPSKL
ncbi:uncharacterized protein LOC134183022 [Corticium candelabrum]|uniref:uncharacterized protein LOC134183022 n=1 Tax=Corticium candelabrum TaxID=121492 RepID=UPI002E269125|nr:uncharacterized protein LOC134183022 [Corticium candelabrum]